MTYGSPYFRKPPCESTVVQNRSSTCHGAKPGAIPPPASCDKPKVSGSLGKTNAETARATRMAQTRKALLGTSCS